MTSRVGSDQKLRIIVLGYMVRGPLGGLIWHHLQYLVGLAKLGHDVYFLEDSDDYPSCYNPQDNSIGTDPSFGLTFVQQTLSHFGLADRWAYFDAHTGNWFGLSGSRAKEICGSAQLVLNLSAVNPLRSWLDSIPHRVFLDTDPVFTQIRNLQEPAKRALAESHTSFFTFAENIVSDDCLVPDDGFKWQPTRQPIVLDAWTVEVGNRKSSWSTVMQWESYANREHDGMRFGMKSESFQPYLDLPRETGEKFELAVGSEAAPRSRLAEGGWAVLNPLEVIRDAWDYQRFIQNSKGEWTVAKHGYVVSRSGWFSERSAAYLASGRPVVTQDTGFSKRLPVGKGLMAFNSRFEVEGALQSVNLDYESHCREARKIAEAYFDSDLILTSLIERAR